MKLSDNRRHHEAVETRQKCKEALGSARKGHRVRQDPARHDGLAVLIVSLHYIYLYIYIYMYNSDGLRPRNTLPTKPLWGPGSPQAYGQQDTASITTISQCSITIGQSALPGTTTCFAGRAPVLARMPWEGLRY